MHDVGSVTQDKRRSTFGWLILGTVGGAGHVLSQGAWQLYDVLMPALVGLFVGAVIDIVVNLHRNSWYPPQFTVKGKLLFTTLIAIFLGTILLVNYVMIIWMTN